MNFQRKRSGFVILLAILMAVLLIPVTTMDAHAAISNTRVCSKYKKKMKSISHNNGTGVSYCYADFDGDRVQEAMITYNAYSGSGQVWQILDYKSGRVKNELKTSEYGLNWVKSYKKSRSFIAYGGGHGGEWYEYYRLKKGKFKKVAEKARLSTAGGSDHTRSWSYTVKGRSSSKSKFNKAIRGIASGKCKKLNCVNRKYLY